jgi:hypothetical protein
MLAAGVLVGVLITWGLLRSGSKTLPDTSQAKAVLEQTQSTSPVRGDEPSPAPTEEQVTAEPASTAVVSASPEATAVAQSSQLPLGVTEEALKANEEMQKKFPGIKTPLINTDGRNLGPEAIQMLETQSQAQPVPFPGINPNVPVTTMPFPQTVEEANRQVQAYALPSASASPSAP